MQDLERKLETALMEIQRLRDENRELKLRFAETVQETVVIPNENETILENKPPIELEPDKSGIHLYSSPSDKIALFRSLFTGREDVYPNRWESKSGKSGYSPACKNEWSIVCKKPQIKCSECSHREFLPLSDEVLSNHLDAKINRTIGVYPMLKDETCWFLAIDFDKQNWQQDSSAVMKTCSEYQIPSALERSRSGNGGHIWIFFERPVPASLARRLGCALLTKTMESRYELGLDSYDRLFPNQDTLPKGGFGNLIALPLQGGPRKAGNSVFVDANLVPYADQWSFLSNLSRMNQPQIESKVSELAKYSEILNVSNWNDEIDADKPWAQQQLDSEKPVEAIPLPSILRITLSNLIYVEKEGLSAKLINQIMRLASFQNPDFYKTQAMRLPTYGKPPVIGCAEDFPKHIGLPRGCLHLVMELMKKYGVPVETTEERNIGDELEVDFTGQLSILQGIWTDCRG